MPDSLDLDAYFERIGYSGSRTPTLVFDGVQFAGL